LAATILPFSFDAFTFGSFDIRLFHGRPTDPKGHSNSKRTIQWHISIQLSLSPRFRVG
jgi:hypothetical protein